ncbi:MAG: FAD-dependent oxidoreductase [Herbinix sp.]|jgi:ferredoxin--NADP+ reductase|nr:FAD-dependent oxidoreductase [Herbinix sp.]
MDKYRVKIIDMKEEAPGTKTFFLEKPSNFIWQEGAHTHIGLIGFDEGELPNKNWVHHMSIMTLPEDNKIGFTTRLLPPFSEFKEKLSDLQIGDEVILFKIGSRMFLRREKKAIILVSMGVGIATMKPLIHRFLKDDAQISRLININVNSTKDFVYRNELDPLQNSNYKNYWIDSRSKFYETLDKVSEQEDAIYYVVGSDEFVKDIIRDLKNKKVEDENILIDKKEEMKTNYFC